MGIRIEKHEEENFKKLDQVIEKYKEEEGMLIRILQKAQDIFGYLPMKVQSYISERLDIPISTVNGIVTFYSLFYQEPQGKYTISVCTGTACYVKGAHEVLDAIKDELQIKEGETTMDKLFTLKTTRCIGACGLAPVITINDDVYGRLTPADIPSILYKYIKTHKKAHVPEKEEVKN
ncbi:NADH-quinone oxidoreductase subunit NuoE [Thermohalobacter berrensis]|uniref:NADH:ubiquinone oxidoreductase n=1 Tax=Thermohalobacter berrensis TaxID=99594 RepID=A0A419SXX3_9FIRM|nr:NADH-quinone oxidoreductase subunit NuoE [Thermohalobacter berrensis]RKD30046.1 NADH:ubiquinone oxidoreductase [Thermohalobacter berrensis]